MFRAIESVRSRVVAYAGILSSWPVKRGRPLESHGSGYGSWTIVPPLSADSVVYSFGIGRDLSFDLSLIRAYGCKVFAFDPTPESLAWCRQQKFPPELSVHALAIACHDGQLTLDSPDRVGHASFRFSVGEGAHSFRCSTYDSIRLALGHGRVDVLKLDIEGCEYPTIPNILGTTCLPTQLLIEFHHRFPPHSLKATKAAVQSILSAGYELVAVSKRAEEFSFIRRGA